MTNTITPETVREALGKATPGPWRAAKCGNGFYVGEIRGPVGTDYEHDVVADWVSEANASLTAMAFDLARAYLDAMDENARLQNERDEAINQASSLKHDVIVLEERAQEFREWGRAVLRDLKGGE